MLLRTLGIPFTELLHPFGNGSNYAAFREFSPTGQVPCLVDGGTVLWESLGIVEYLAERDARVWPADAAARAWARCAAAEMHAGFATLRARCTMNVGLRIRMADIPPALARDIARLGEMWNDGLARFGGPFLAGADFTAVDAFFAPVAFRVQTYSITLSGAAADYPARLLALPAMQEWQAAGLAETWREPGHEEEARQAGIWLEDRRAAA